jgi:HAD superfamily hydrolase (TIGR01509 family)
MAQRTGADPGHVARILVSEIEHRADTSAADWMPGARELLITARDSGIPVAIVSNSWRVLVDLFTANIDTPVDLIVSSTEVTPPKPDPQPYLHACAALGVTVENCVVVEDSPTGVAAGLASGAAVLGVGAAVRSLDGPRYRHVDSLADVSVAWLGEFVHSSFGGDGGEDAHP